MNLVLKTFLDAYSETSMCVLVIKASVSNNSLHEYFIDGDEDYFTEVQHNGETLYVYDLFACTSEHVRAAITTTAYNTDNVACAVIGSNADVHMAGNREYITPLLDNNTISLSVGDAYICGFDNCKQVQR